jgi:peptidoglycan/xylan/chitin deacetylase (PgdA/CDA1 family)
LHDSLPMISIVIPAYNRESTIAQTLDSLIRQTHEGWEAIVVDDGSNDGTADVVMEYAKRDPRFRCHRQVNSGVSAARNAGIAVARFPWLFFLDADDWIAPTAFAALLDAQSAAGDGIAAIYGGYIRIDEHGREIRERRPQPEEDLFPVFTRMCAFAIHTCLIRTDLVRSVGAFDEALVTCEDWDLWQRIARTGARFLAIPDYIAYYRMRVGSASANGARMLDDGLRVIERGHAPDTRVATVHPAHSQGGPVSAKPLARTYFVCYAAGLVMAGGADARWMLDSLGQHRPTDLSADGIAETLFFAVPNGRASSPEDWSSFPPDVLERCREFIDAIGEWMVDKWLSFQTRRSFERLMLGAVEGPKPRTVGAWHIVEIDCDGEPPQHIDCGPAVSYVLCAVKVGGADTGIVELPANAGWAPPRVLADGIADRLAWDILRHWLARDVYPTMEIERMGALARVSRAGVVLLEQEVTFEYPFEEWLHDRVGWTVLMQEIWSHPTWQSDQFYSDEPETDVKRTIDAGEDPVAVEITAPLPQIRCRAESAAIGVTLAGVPLATLRLPTRRTHIRPHEIRQAILTCLGFEFCRAVIRELILAPPSPPGAPLRDVLANAAAQRASIPEPESARIAESQPRALVAGWHRAIAELLPPGAGATVIGRRTRGADGTGVSRYAVLPESSYAQLLAGAEYCGDPVLEIVGAQPHSRVVYAPCVQWDRSSALGATDEDEALLTQLEFEQVFAARPDPWSYASDYEQHKYEQTLSLVPSGVRQAMEIGCAEGAFTVRLAEKVPSVLACDISTVALSRAARACSQLSNVTFMQLDLFKDDPPGGYELIVCSELLYYAPSRDQLAGAVRRISHALAPGGLFLSANAHGLVDDEASSGFDWDVPFAGKQIGETILATGLFDRVDEIRTAPYRIQMYRMRKRRRLLRLRRSPQGAPVELAQTGEMSPEAASRYFPEGGRVRHEHAAPPPASDPKLPVLMYHRIAAEGSQRTARWRIHPDDFEQQLKLLRAKGYYSLTFEQWRAAANMRRVLPGKPILITFDDGYEDFPREAAPLLLRYGFRATIFVVSELVGRSNVWDSELEESLPLMGWETIERLASEGLDFGSHSALHRPLVTLDQGQLAEDLARSKRSIEEHLGHAVTSVSYPFGLHDATVESVAAACGYEYGVTTDEWLASWSDSLISLPRLEVRGTDSIEDFAAMVGL